VKRNKAAHIQKAKLSGRQSSQGAIRESTEVQSKSNVWLALLCTPRSLCWSGCQCSRRVRSPALGPSHQYG